MTCWVELASDNRVSRELDSELIHLIVASNQNGQKQESNTQVVDTCAAKLITHIQYGRA